VIKAVDRGIDRNQSEKSSARRDTPGRLQAQYPTDNPDDWVAWNFRRSWRRGGVRAREDFGSDYDYYGAVISEAIRYYTVWAGREYDPDPKGNDWYGRAPKGYGDYYGVWQNTKLVTPGTPLVGPQVDFGPLVDYGLFLEQWNLGDGPNIPVLRSIGVIHALARFLQRRWKGVHVIYAMPIAPKELSAAVREKREKYAKPHPKFGKLIGLYPIIRIQPRHYK